ncbi:AIG_G0004860.mRNA.1.CDS.1 [Saccharomyces cerevisiae]|nr:AIG_G0004860.mRNA.1.CDS.1 [Saccharomyces cerevisiae]CAI6511837.1 AIG_G0004860.mRNA.1.CDS.1 [Saccharomyces cerevisiae]
MTVGEVAHGSDNALYTSAARYEVRKFSPSRTLKLVPRHFSRYNIVPFTLETMERSHCIELFVH